MTRNRYLSDGVINKMLQEEDNSEANDDEIDVDDFVQDSSYSPMKTVTMMMSLT